MKQSFSQMSDSVESIRTNAFRDGAQACREMMARFVEQGGDAVTANSIRLNWNPDWGNDPGKPETDVPPPPRVSVVPEGKPAVNDIIGDCSGYYSGGHP